MHPSLSQRSLEAWSEASAFNRELRQEQQSCSVILPKGIYVRAPLSARAAGSSIHMRRYDVTVTPRVWPRKSTSIRKVLQEVRSEIEDDFEEEDEDDFNLKDERSTFRRNRARQFQISSHFPALVSPRIVPVWRDSGVKKQEVLLNTQAKASQNLNVGSGDLTNSLLKKTISLCAKKREKHQEEMATPWMGSGIAGVGSQTQRIPLIHQGDTYEHGEGRGELSKEWVGDTTLFPVGKASYVQRSTTTDLGGAGILEGNKESVALSKELQDRRAIGSKMREELKRRYVQRRAAYQKTHGKVVSSFYVAEQRKQQAESAVDSQQLRETLTGKGEARTSFGIHLRKGQS